MRNYLPVTGLISYFLFILEQLLINDRFLSVTFLLLVTVCSSFIGCFSGGLFIRDFSESLSISDSFLSVDFFNTDWLFVSEESFINGYLFTSDVLFINYGLYQWRVCLSVTVSDIFYIRFEFGITFLISD